MLASAWPAPAFADRLRSAMVGPVLTEEDVAAAPADAAPETTGAGDDVALVLFTSGTTGLPKPVSISHRSIADRLAFYGKPIDPELPQVVDMMSAPIFHIGGTLGLFVSLYQGKQLVLLPKFEAGEWLSLVESPPGDPDVRRAHHAPTDPRPPAVREHRPLLAAVAQLRGRRRPGRISSAGRSPRCLTSTSPTPSGRPRRWGPSRPSTPEDHRRGDRFDSVGRPLAGVEVRIVDPGDRPAGGSRGPR